MSNFIIPNHALHTSKNHLYSGSIKYDFPIHYPDWVIGSLGYVKRLRGNISYEQCITQFHSPKHHNEHLSGISVGLLVDMHLLPIINTPLCTIGIKYVYKLQQKTGGFSFSIDLTSKAASS